MKYGSLVAGLIVVTIGHAPTNSRWFPNSCLGATSIETPSRNSKQSFQDAGPQMQNEHNVRAAPPPKQSLPEEAKNSMRAWLIRRIPPTLHEASPGWGHTKRAPSRIKWQGQGLNTHAKLVETDKNDGVWRRIKITAENVPQSLVFDLTNVQHPRPGITTFDVFAALNTRVDYEQQNWLAGARIYSGRVQARVRAKADVSCEMTSRLEFGRMLLPEEVIRVRAVSAKLGYDHLVVEHIAGVGGDAAKVLGQALLKLLHELDPSLERELLAKANAAILRAADTKEIRIGLATLLKETKRP
jgi:hypothetical protein